MSEGRRVLVISKHSLFREGLRRVLGELEGFELMEAVPSLEEAAAMAVEALPDIIVFDGEGGPRSGTELAQLFQLSPDRIVTLSLADTEMTVFTRRQVRRATVEDLLTSIQQAEE